MEDETYTPPPPSPAPRDPESLAVCRESATYGEFVVVITDADGERLGRLDDVFVSDFEAAVAAHDNQIEDLGITAEVRRLDD